MAIIGSGGVRRPQGEKMMLGQMDPNGGPVQHAILPKRNKQRTGRQENTMLRDERGNSYAASRNVNAV